MKERMLHCGLCQIKLKDPKSFKLHTEGALHRRNLERASKGEFGLASGGVASGILAKEALGRMDEAFNELKKGLSGEDTAEIVRKAQERERNARSNR